ncbi:Uncharacterised protein [Alistipes finegoldii]|nr:Uncharacterised protein [Alistipes finegoldii]
MNRTLRKCCAALLAILAVYAAPAAEKTVYLKDFLAPGGGFALKIEPADNK